MTIVYRTAGAWGAGKGADLTPAEVDSNFRDLFLRALTLQTATYRPSPPQTLTLDSDGVIDITLENANSFSIRPPFVPFNWRGMWQPSTFYARWDVVGIEADGVYLVEEDHTSDVAFDPDADLATDGVSATYALMLSYVEPPADSGDHDSSPYHGGIETTSFTGNYQPFFNASTDQSGTYFRFIGASGNFTLPGNNMSFRIGTEFTVRDMTTGGSSGGVSIFPNEFHFYQAQVVGPGGTLATDVAPLVTTGYGAVAYCKKVVGSSGTDPNHVWEVWGDVTF